MIYGTVHGALRSIVGAGWNVKSSGEVDAPTGHFAIVEIPAHDGERAEMRNAVFSESPEEGEAFDTLPDGWFMVIEDYQGNVGIVKLDDEAEANLVFKDYEEAYAEWAETDSEG